MVLNLERAHILSYMKQQESMAEIADGLGEAQISGDWHLAESFADRVSSVRAKDIKQALRLYATHFTWAYIGDEKVGEDAFGR